MKANINSIIARYQQSFGYIAANVAVAAANRLWAASIHIDKYTENDTQPGEMGDIAVFQVADSTFADCTLVGADGKVYHFGMTDDPEADFNFLPIMVDFSRGKNVVTTPIDRSEIEVIEYFGLKPWIVNVQGILIDESERQYPSAAVKSISELFAKSGTYSIVGQIFDDLGITEVFLESDLRITFVEGYVDTVSFAFSMKSTEPAEYNVVS